MGTNKLKENKKDKLFIFVMIAPAVVLLFAFVIMPLFIGLYISFFRTSGIGIGPKTFVGWSNYGAAFRDSVFWLSIKNTMYYAVFVTVAKNVLGLIFAVILMKNIRGVTLFRVAAFIPVTFSFIVTGVLWSWIYSPVFGILNEFLKAIGAEGFIKQWLSDPDVALTSICLVDVWKWLGFHMVIYIAGLQKIPQELYESASIDGANSLKQFRHITVPQMNSTIILNILVAFTGGFVQNYDLVKVMTDGGPFNSTEVALTHIVRVLLSFFEVGKANAMTIILVLFVSVFGFLQLKIMTKEDTHD